MNGEVEVYRDPLTAVQVRAQVNLIQEVMKSVMQNGQHYGVIPGAGNKPTLLKPGAEKLMLTFNLTPDPIVEDLSTGDAHRYRVTCRIYDRDGHYLGAGLGEASSNEEKYKWRGVVCPEEYAEAPEDRKRSKWKKGYGNEPAKRVLQIRTEPADIANTILKMAKKRALVDATLTVTAASDIFTQDLEDMPTELINRKEPVTDKPLLVEYITDAQVSTITDLLNDKEIKATRLLKYLGAESVEKILVTDYQKSVASINATKGKGKREMAAREAAA